MKNDLQTLLASISQGVYLLGQDGRMCLYNQRLCELLDIPASFFDQHPTLAEMNAYQMQQGDFGDNASLVDAHARNYVLTDGQAPTPSQFLRMTRTGRTLEVRSRVLPDGGMVRTFAD
ncbi:MAG: GGDEF domain-containing protein, partial [Comamonadaceae bacterium CG17_big_fil_post_rev_8_21_14_2_50_60_13]